MSHQNFSTLDLSPDATATREAELIIDIDQQVNDQVHDHHLKTQDHASIDPHASTSAPQEVATGVYVTVHGHFYQPPRENPYLDAVERQPSAAPFHDWNERIHYECYRPNAFARIFNDRGEVVQIVNNYEYLSFNMGATLLSWLERYDRETYQKIIEADRLSQQRLGHGNAIAQVYNHIIMPLANERDKYTQIRWGKEDFRSRFGREPEGMWLAETAVDYPTLEVLIAEGIKFIILAPSQAERCRPLNNHENHENSESWQEVGGSQIDPTRPYRCYLQDRSASIDIFFYDGPISRDMGFSDVLTNSYFLTGRIGQAVRGDHRPHQLIAVATDGETFGHHKGGAEKCLAYAFTHEFVSRGWQVTNFAHYLTLHPPEWEVELKPVTAWSCAHGVDRWQDDCGCGGGGTWHQKWRKPLRTSLNWLRDELVKVYETEGSKLFRDVWQARDEYIRVIGDRSPQNIEKFFATHCPVPLSPLAQIDALRLLEMQRHALLMFTSCGWFFEEISRPEGVQILRYAARAIELAGDVAGVQLEREFIQQLQAAPSNVEYFNDGAKIYAELVTTAVVNFTQVAAQYAISSLFPSSTLQESKQIYCYKVEQQDWQMQRLGVLTLAVGQLQLTSEITLESSHLVFAVLHLGGWDFHCCLQPFEGRLAYSQIKTDLFATLQGGSAGIVILEMNRLFANSKSYGLQDLLAEERHRIMGLLTTETINRLDQLYTQAYRDNYGVLMAFHRDELPPPPELQVAAEVALSHRVIHGVQSLVNSETEQVWLEKLETIAKESQLLHCRLNILEVQPILEQLVWQGLWELLYPEQSAPQSLNSSQNQCQVLSQAMTVPYLQRLLLVSKELGLTLRLDRSQELYFQWRQNLTTLPTAELGAIGKLLSMAD